MTLNTLTYNVLYCNCNKPKQAVSEDSEKEELENTVILILLNEPGSEFQSLDSSLQRQYRESGYKLMNLNLCINFLTCNI